MAKKKSDGTGLIIGIALIIWVLASIPQEIWILIGIIGISVLIYQLFFKNSNSSNSNQSSPAEYNRESGYIVQPSYLGHDSDFRIPAPTHEIMPKARWVPQGETVTVGGVNIDLGMIYVGSGLRSNYYDIDSALINPSLKVSANDVDVSLDLTSYWPSYSDISPDARKGYLKWHSTGRKNPKASIGYVFLFFYGLERRALVDAKNDATAKNDLPLIKAEVRRLLGIYESSQSFQRYASQFLDFISAREIQSKVYLQAPPEIIGQLYELPISIRIGLGQLAVDQKPVPPDWALAWAMVDPNITKRTAVKRCYELFVRLFMQKYIQKYGAGLNLKVNRTKLVASYRAASSGLNSFNFTTTIDGLPDVTVLKGPINKLQDLVTECTNELDSYSRYIGRNPDKAEALEGLLQLPPSLWPLDIKAELDEIKSRVGEGLILINFAELAGRLKSSSELTRDKVLGLAKALESMNLGMEPDVLAGAKTPKAEDKIALFSTHPEDGAVRSSSSYVAAAVTLDLACIAALADGEASAHELSFISSQINSWVHLSESHRKRLKAHLRLGIDQPATLQSLKKKLEGLPKDGRHSIARFLAHLSQADGKVLPEEVKFLERTYKMLDLDAQQVYSDLHVQASGTASVTAISQKESNTNKAAGGFTLDPARIAELQKETAAVSALLADIFVDDNSIEIVELEVTQEQEPLEDTSTILGLDREQSAFLRRLITRPSWTREELSDIADDMELMLDGALEHINESVLDTFDNALTEGDDPVEINQEIVEKLAV